MKHYNNWTNIYFYFIVSLLLILNISTFGQSAPDKQRKQLQEYLEVCQRSTHNSKILSMTDSLIQKANKGGYNDITARAIQARGEYFYNKGMIAELLNEKAKLETLFTHKPQEDEIFILWNRIIEHYINKYDSRRALDEIKLYQKEAVKLNNIYGQGYVYLKSGNVYFMLRDYELAIEQYEKGLHFFKHKGIDKYNSEFNVYISSAYFNNGEFEKSKKYMEDLLKNEKKKRPSVIVQLALCNAKLGKNEETKANLEELEKLAEEYPFSKSTTNNYHIASTLYNINIEHPQEALNHAKQISNKLLQALYIKECYKSMKEYSTALKYSEIMNELSDSITAQENSQQLAYFASQYDATRLREERNLLELNNTQLTLERINNEHNLMLSINKEKELELKNKNLLIHQQDINLEKQKALAAKQKAERTIMQKSIKMQERDRQILLIGTIVIALVVWIQSILLVHLYQQKKAKERAFKEANIAKQQAEQAKKEAESADQMKSLFLQNMSHEIRTPLNAIVGFTSMLNDPDMEFSQNEKEQFLTLVQDNSQQLTTLVNDLLDLSKLESGTYKVLLKNINVEDLCIGTVMSIKGKEAKGVTLQMVSPDDEATTPNGIKLKALTINTDIIRVKQVLTNFITNACKYTEKGSITLTYTVRKARELEYENELIFSVTDTGCGIKSEHASLVFERFEKLGSFKKGTGLGLNICKKIAELLNGKVMLDTDYQQGSRFLFILPL